MVPPKSRPEATGDTEAARSDQGTDLRPRHRFSNILMHFRSINVTFVWEAKIANRGYILYVAFWIVVVVESLRDIYETTRDQHLP